MQLVVLGMHRSGTSAVARLLNMMGAYFCAEGVEMPSQPDNPKGHWERLDVVAVNDRLLAAQRQGWQEVGRFDPARLAPEVEAEFRARAWPIVQRLDAHRPWMVKDPRLCLTFPLWRPLLELPVCVIVHRHPLQVAESLRARNGLPLPLGVALWERYATSLLEAARGLPKVLVLHAELMARPVEAVAALHGELTRLGVQGLRRPAEPELRAFLDERLFRQRADPARAPGYLNPLQARLCEALEQRQLPRLEEPWPCSPGALELLRHHDRALRLLRGLGRRRARVRALAAKAAALEPQAEELGRRSAALEGQVRELGERRAALEGQVRELGERNAALEGQARELGERKAALEGQARELGERNAALEGEVRESGRRAAALEAEVGALRRRVGLRGLLRDLLRVDRRARGGRPPPAAGER